MTADTVGGVWTYATELARALAPHGVEVALATMGRALDEGQRREITALANVTLHESDYRLEWMESPWSDVEAAGAWLQRIAAEWSPDVVHLNGYAHAALEWPAPTLVVAHSCVCSWWRAVRGEAAPAEWNAYRDAVRAGLRAADVVLAPTQAMLDALVTEYGALPSTRMMVNGRHAPRLPAARKQPFVLSAGRLWDEAKNLRLLRDAAPGLAWPFYVAGETIEPGRADSHAAGDASLRHLGQLPARELAIWMLDASIYALPARYEPFGLSVLEAALAGCALVLGDIPSLRELWHDAALFVDPASPDALRRAIAALIDDERLRTRMADAARARASRYSPERMATGYMETYATLKAAARSEVTACA